MNLHFKGSLIWAVGLSLITYSCGDLKSFQESINFQKADVKQNGLAEFSEGISFSDNNSGVDIIISHTPKNKPQANSPISLKISGFVRTYPKESGLVKNMETDALSLMSGSPVDINNDRDETEFRVIEDDFLKTGLTQKIMKDRSVNFFKTNSFKEGDTWNNGIKVTKTSNGLSVTALIQAKCVAVTDNAYFFTEVGKDIDASLLKTYTDGFTKIYPNVVGHFGEPNDVDGNGKVIILFYDMGESSNTLGYFYSADKYSRSEISVSNEADIFYVNYNFAKNKDKAKTILGTLAHEFQHMIYYDTKYNKIMNKVSAWADYDGDSWLNEGLSMLSEYYTEYTENVDKWVLQFFLGNYKGLSLTHWTSQNYGYSGIFTRYLAEKEPELTKKIYDSNQGGLKAVEVAFGRDFNDIFADFLQSIYLSNQKIGNDPDYIFSSIDLSKYIFGHEKIKVGGEQYIELRPYEFVLIKVDGDTSKLSIPEKMKGYSSIKLQ